MARFLLNPTFDIETGRLLSHDGEFFEEPKILFDRSATNQAKAAGQGAQSVAGGAGAQAQQVGSTIIPTLERTATNPTGLTPTQRNNYMVSAQEATGGVNAGLKGAADLATARTRNAGGYSAALDEAARQKQRQMATSTQDVNNLDTQLANQKQAQALQQLQGLYGTDTSNMLKAMGLQNQDLETQLAAGRQGWLQNTMGTLGTLSGMGLGAAKAAGFG